MDTNVVINLIHINMLGHLSAISSARFVITDVVFGELSKPKFKKDVRLALNSECLERHPPVTDLEQLRQAASYRQTMQKGEAESLAVAAANHWLLAGDERKRFRPAAEAALGPNRLLTTAGMIMQFIRLGSISVQDADAAKLVLSRNGYVMSFASFSELCIGVPIP